MKTKQQDLIDAGYKKWVSKSNEVLKNTDTLFQKRVFDDTGTLYFINCWWYEPTYRLEESVQFEVQYTMQDGEHLNVMSFYEDIETNEKFFYDMWSRMCFDYYEK